MNSVWDDNPFHLGTYEYDADYGDHIQIFPVQNLPPDDRLFPFVQLKVLSNHGSPIYTSLCRYDFFHTTGRLLDVQTALQLC